MSDARRELAANQKELSDEMRRILKKLNAIPKEFRAEERKKVLTEAAHPLIQAAQENAPQSTQPHKIYKKGRNEPTIYYPGNLKKSIQIIPYRKSASVFVGPKIAKRGKAKAYGRNAKNVDAFYAGFVEFGTSQSRATPYMRPAFDSSKAAVLRLATRGFEDVMKKYERKNSVNG